MKAGQGLTIKRMVELARVSRASFYRFDRVAEEDGPDPDMDLRDAIQRIALEWPSYGRRRITAALRRHSWTVNAKRVYRLMCEDNLLCVRKRKFMRTTNSNHGRKVYPNLAADIVLTGTDQLWRADITYIRLREEFVFLAIILDALTARDWLGSGPDNGRCAHLECLTNGTVAASGRTRPGPSLRSRFAIRQQRLHGPVEREWHRHKYVAQGESMG